MAKDRSPVQWCPLHRHGDTCPPLLQMAGHGKHLA